MPKITHGCGSEALALPATVHRFRSRSALAPVLGVGGKKPPAYNLFAKTFGHVDPGFRLAVRLDLACARISAGAAVVLATLDDAGALLVVVLGGESLVGGGGQAEGHEARHSGADDAIGCVHAVLHRICRKGNSRCRSAIPAPNANAQCVCELSRAVHAPLKV